MASMAQWGDITFQVNSDRVFTFRKMKRTYSTRWAGHEILGDRPKMEFQGPGMDEITIEVVLDAELGVNPRDTMQLFHDAAKRGEVNHFYVGGKRVAENKFYIAGGTESWNEIWNEGELIRASASLTFGEYR